MLPSPPVLPATIDRTVADPTTARTPPAPSAADRPRPGTAAEAAEPARAAAWRRGQRGRGSRDRPASVVADSDSWQRSLRANQCPEARFAGLRRHPWTSSFWRTRFEGLHGPARPPGPGTPG